MESSITVRGVTLTWNPLTRVFDYRTEDQVDPLPRADEETLASWIRQQSGGQPYGILIGPSPRARRRTASGFSLAELMHERARARVACYGMADSETVLLPVLSALTGVRMKSFATRADAEAWLKEGLGFTINPSTSPTARP